MEMAKLCMAGCTNCASLTLLISQTLFRAALRMMLVGEQ